MSKSGVYEIKLKYLLRIKTAKGFLLVGAVLFALLAIYFSFFFIDYRKEGIPPFLLTSLIVYVIAMSLLVIKLAKGLFRVYRRRRDLKVEELGEISAELESLGKISGMAFGREHLYFYEYDVFGFLVCLAYRDIKKTTVNRRRPKSSANDKKAYPKTLGIVFTDFNDSEYTCADKEVLKFSSYYLKKIGAACSGITSA